MAARAATGLYCSRALFMFSSVTLASLTFSEISDDVAFVFSRFSIRSVSPRISPVAEERRLSRSSSSCWRVILNSFCWRIRLAFNSSRSGRSSDTTRARS